MNAYGNNAAYARASKALLPEAVTVLGVPRLLYIEDPSTGRNYEFLPPPATVLCSDDEGREMFILSPIRDAGRPQKNDQAIRAERLYEQFTNRHADGLYNAFVPAFKRPAYRGRVILIRYVQRKDLDAESRGKEIEWEHYFEAPDYPDLWHVGHQQYYIPRGKWRVAEAGIEHAD